MVSTLNFEGFEYIHTERVEMKQVSKLMLKLRQHEIITYLFLKNKVSLESLIVP